VACGSQENPIGIARIDGDLRNLLGIAHAEMRPRFAGIGRLVYTVADREVWPVQPLTTTDINNVRVGRRYGNCADGARWLIVKNRLPSLTIVIGLPHTAIAYAK